MDLDEFLHLTAFIGVVAPQMEPSWVMDLGLKAEELRRRLYVNTLLVMLQTRPEMVCTLLQAGRSDFLLASNVGFSEDEEVFCRSLYDSVCEKREQGLDHARKLLLNKRKVAEEAEAKPGKKKKVSDKPSENTGGSADKPDGEEEKAGGKPEDEEELEKAGGGANKPEEEKKATDRSDSKKKKARGGDKSESKKKKVAKPSGGDIDELGLLDEQRIAEDSWRVEAALIKMSRIPVKALDGWMLSWACLAGLHRCFRGCRLKLVNKPSQGKYKFRWEDLTRYISNRGHSLQELEVGRFSGRMKMLKSIFEAGDHTLVNHSEGQALDDLPASDRFLFLFCFKLCCVLCSTRVAQLEEERILGSHGKLYPFVVPNEAVRQQMEGPLYDHIDKIFSPEGYRFEDEDKNPEASIARFLAQLEQLEQENAASNPGRGRRRVGYSS